MFRCGCCILVCLDRDVAMEVPSSDMMSTEPAEERLGGCGVLSFVSVESSVVGVSYVLSRLVDPSSLPEDCHDLIEGSVGPRKRDNDVDWTLRIVSISFPAILIERVSILSLIVDSGYFAIMRADRSLWSLLWVYVRETSDGDRCRHCSHPAAFEQ